MRGPYDEILRTAREHQSNVILIGGYSRRPALELVLGSTVKEVLREARHPLLVFT